MPIEIGHRDTGVVLHTVDAETLRGADLSEANLNGADLSRANLTGADLIRADLHGADLRGANLNGANLNGADLRRATLTGASLNGAYLSGAHLSGAYLSRADLNGANLNGAYLSGAHLSGANIYADKLDRLLARATRLDGFEFFLFSLQDGSPKIKAGCRWMTLADYRAHVSKEYPDTDKAQETLDILNFFEARAR